MREKLAKMNGVRATFEGVVGKFGWKRGYNGDRQPTLLLKDVKLVDTGEVVTDHLWFTMGKRWEMQQLTIGDRVRFEARVKPYIKGYRGYRKSNYYDYDEEEDEDDVPQIEMDYKLSYPTKIRKVSEENTD